MPPDDPVPAAVHGGRDFAAGCEIRPMQPDDAPAAADVFYAAQDELYDRLNQPRLPRNETALASFLQRLIGSDPERAWVAEVVAAGDGRAPGELSDPTRQARRAVAFGAAIRRETFWFLSFLFVRPEAQGEGLGRRLLERCMPPPGVDDPPDVLATCVESLQPVSTALYAGYGIVPRVPLFTLVGEPREGALPTLPSSVEARTFESIAGGDGEGHRRLVQAVEHVDRETLGHARPLDHRAWRVLESREGVLYTARVSGEVLGYGYVQDSGRLGPVALLDPDLLPATIGDLTGRSDPAGAWQVYVPGVAQAALVALLRAGLRLEGTPALFCATRDAPRLEGYLPAGFALL